MRKTLWRLFALMSVLLALGALAVACGGDDDDDDDDDAYGDDDSGDDDIVDDDSGGDVVDVTIADMDVSPDPVTIDAGGTVRWTNEDSVPHDMVSGEPDAPDGEFDSGELATGDSFEHTFDTPGTYTYFCEIHPGTMFGYEVIVN